MKTGRTRSLEVLERTAQEIRASVARGELPELEFPVRALSNVKYDVEHGVFTLGPAVKTRALTANSVRSFAQVLRMMGLSRQLLLDGDFASKREAYYVSKNWGDCRFREQAESDTILDDIEALASRDGLSREELGFFPEEHGGSVAGHVVVVDRDPETGERTRIDCTALGRGAYSVPRAVDHLELESDARFVLAIETGGMFQRLSAHKFWREHRCVLVELGGVPTRATRRFLRRLADEHELPILCFVDCDPYGIANIYRTLKAGSGNAAHVSESLAVPSAAFLGVTPADIEEFGLEDATHPLTAADAKRAHDALDHDPFFLAHVQWRAALRQLLDMGVRAEQQALAKWGLNFVIEEYLPRKLSDPDAWLP